MHINACTADTNRCTHRKEIESACFCQVTAGHTKSKSNTLAACTEVALGFSPHAEKLETTMGGSLFVLNQTVCTRREYCLHILSVSLFPFPTLYSLTQLCFQPKALSGERNEYRNQTLGMEGCRILKRRTERTRSYRNIGRNNRRTGGRLVVKVRRRSELCVCV